MGTNVESPMDDMAKKKWLQLAEVFGVTAAEMMKRSLEDKSYTDAHKIREIFLNLKQLSEGDKEFVRRAVELKEPAEELKKTKVAGVLSKLIAGAVVVKDLYLGGKDIYDSHKIDKEIENLRQEIEVLEKNGTPNR